MTDGILDAMAAELERRQEWDEAPALYFLYDNPDGLHLSQLDIPADRWALDRPPEVLRWLAERLASSGGFLSALAPQGLCAVAFRFEAWTVAGPAADPLLRATAELDAHDHVLHLRPDRVEARMMMAAGQDGTIYQVVHCRDGQVVPRLSSGPLGEGGSGTFGGSVPQSLSMIIAAIGPEGEP